MRNVWNDAIAFQIVNHWFHLVLPDSDVLFGVIVSYKRYARKGSFKHSLFGALMSKMPFVAAVVAISRSPALVFSLVLHGRPRLSSYMVLSPDFWTGINEVSGHAAAVAMLVPEGPLAAGAERVPRKSTVAAVPIGAVSCMVAQSATKEARCAFFGIGAVL